MPAGWKCCGGGNPEEWGVGCGGALGWGVEGWVEVSGDLQGKGHSWRWGTAGAAKWRYEILGCIEVRGQGVAVVGGGRKGR